MASGSATRKPSRPNARRPPGSPTLSSRSIGQPVQSNERPDVISQVLAILRDGAAFESVIDGLLYPLLAGRQHRRRLVRRGVHALLGSKRSHRAGGAAGQWHCSNAPQGPITTAATGAKLPEARTSKPRHHWGQDWMGLTPSRLASSENGTPSLPSSAVLKRCALISSLISRASSRWGDAPSAQDHEIVRISDEASAEALLKPELLPPQHKPPHVKIGQQW